MIGRETVPVLARVLVRQGSADVPEWLARAARHAATADVLEWLVPTGLAHIEQAWLAGDHGRAGPYPGLLLERTDRPGMAVQRGELLLYLGRLGYPAAPFAGCPSRTPRRCAATGVRRRTRGWRWATRTSTPWRSRNLARSSLVWRRGAWVSPGCRVGRSRAR
jgi:hypothetical protein